MLDRIEKIAILKEERSDEELAHDAHVCVKTVYRWKYAEKFDFKSRAKRRHADELIQNALYQFAELPWSKEADQQIFELYSLMVEKSYDEIRKLFSFSSNQAYRIVETIDPNASSFDEDQWGSALFSYYYYLALTLSKYRNVRKKLEVSESICLRMISTVNKPWADVLSWKILANRVVRKWNSTLPKETRASPEMMAFIESVNYFDSLKRFMQLVPFDSTAPLNALAICSRFKAADKYAELHDCLRRIHPGFPEDSDLDEDFDDFLRWLDGQPHPRAEQRDEKQLWKKRKTATITQSKTGSKMTIRKMTLVLTAILSATVASQTTGSVRSTDIPIGAHTELADLKPHASLNGPIDGITSQGDEKSSPIRLVDLRPH